MTSIDSVAAHAMRARQERDARELAGFIEPSDAVVASLAARTSAQVLVTKYLRESHRASVLRTQRDRLRRVVDQIYRAAHREPRRSDPLWQDWERSRRALVGLADGEEIPDDV